MKKWIAMLLALALLACGAGIAEEAVEVSDKAAIEAALNLDNMDQEWTYSEETDAWTLSVVTAVTKPVVESEEGVSVCVPGAYVTGIDTDGDGAADVTAEAASGAVKGGLVIDWDARITSENGQVYTAATAPVILNTGAAGYGNSTSTPAAATYAAQGYVNVSCGNRGKQDSYTDANGNVIGYGIDENQVTDAIRFGVSLNGGFGIEWQIVPAIRWNLEQTVNIGLPSLSTWMCKTGLAYCF